jgi:Domain of unknown function (DUF4062)
VAGAGDSGDVRWKVFISHTSELREFPRETSYVAAVERAIAAAEHVIVDMRDFSSADQAAADVCAARVRECDVYIGILGTRYGSPVPDKPEQSYTELEFETATGAGLDRLEARALALSGLAVVAGDQASARAAAEAFTRARAATSAPGVVADTRRLLDMVTAHDQSGALARLLSG